MVRTLGFNPRALSIFTSRLKDESLEALIGRHPEMWETSDREFSPDLLRHLERDIIQAAFLRLTERELQLLQWLSILRLPFQHQAIIHLSEGHTEAAAIRQKLRHLYFLEHNQSLYKLHPIVKEIARQKLVEKNSSFIKAHKKVAGYYTRHFVQGDIKNKSKLGGDFVEARYHLTLAKDTDTLHKIIRGFGDFIHATIFSGTPVPTEQGELNERIAMLIAYLNVGGGYNIEFHLARCLKKRAEPGDLSLALEHALKATELYATVDALLMAAELYVANNNTKAALLFLQEGINKIHASDKVHALYVYRAELLYPTDLTGAIEFLKQGIRTVPPDKSLSSIYTFCAELMVKNNDLEGAIELIKSGTVIIPPDKGLTFVYTLGAELMVKNNDLAGAIKLIKRGTEVIPHDKGLMFLYTLGGELMIKDEKISDAIDFLRNGVSKISHTNGRSKIIDKIITIMFRYGRISDFAEIKGIPVVAKEEVLYKILSCYNSENYTKMAETADASLKFTDYHTLFLHYIFALLGCQQYEQAFLTLESRTDFSLKLGTNAWLLAFASLKTGNQAQANSCYKLLQPAFTGDVTEKTLVQYWWHTRKELGPYPSYTFPILPATLTGYDASLRIFDNNIEENIKQYLTSETPKEQQTEPAAEPLPAGKPKILCIATEWASKNGGLSTFNRYLCNALAEEGYEVVCLVPNSSEHERKEALSGNVQLIDAPEGTGLNDFGRLQSRIDLPTGFKPDIIIGHDRITGPAMLAQQDSFFPAAKKILFIHTAPEEIEWLKPADEGETQMGKAEERRQLQRKIALKSDLVVAVGPRLYNEIYMQLGINTSVKIVRFDPGLMSKAPTGSNVIPPAIWCQIFGRMDDGPLKGLDIAIKVMDKVYTRIKTPIKPVLIIRGVVKGTDVKLLNKEHPLSSGLPIRLREYDPDAENLLQELNTMSLILMPSRAEGFGLTGLESISAGCPVLLSNKSGLAELIQEFVPEEAHYWVVSVEGDESNFLPDWERQAELILMDRKAARERINTLRTKLSEKISWTNSVKIMMEQITQPQAQATTSTA